MNRYVFKINDSTYVSDIHWITYEIPHEIKTSGLQEAMIVADSYLDFIVRKGGFGEGVTRKEALLQYYPHINVVKIKIVEDE